VYQESADSVNAVDSAVPLVGDTEKVPKRGAEKMDSVQAHEVTSPLCLFVA
jgi:hypothetical protein